MKKSKKITIAVISIILFFLIAVGVYGYFTYQAEKENLIILGYNEVEINEIYNPLIKIEIEPGKTARFTKQPWVTNTSNVECYVRVKTKVSDSRIEKDLRIDYDSSTDINDNSKKWYYNENDGYYYYKEVLEPNGGRTSDLFTYVEILDTVEQERLSDGFDIFVYAESVQTIENKSMQEVWNYFKAQNN